LLTCTLGTKLNLLIEMVADATRVADDRLIALGHVSVLALVTLISETLL
jgi:hypothetical protein